MSYDIFLIAFLNILDKYASVKYLKANLVTCITKEVRKEMMIRSKLWNKFMMDKNNQKMIIENNAIYVFHLFTGKNRNIFLVFWTILENSQTALFKQDFS